MKVRWAERALRLVGGEQVRRCGGAQNDKLIASSGSAEGVQGLVDVAPAS